MFFFRGLLKRERFYWLRINKINLFIYCTTYTNNYLLRLIIPIPFLIICLVQIQSHYSNFIIIICLFTKRRRNLTKEYGKKNEGNYFRKLESKCLPLFNQKIKLHTNLLLPSMGREKSLNQSNKTKIDSNP